MRMNYMKITKNKKKKKYQEKKKIIKKLIQIYR